LSPEFSPAAAPPTSRSVVYSAALRIVVVSISESLVSVQRLADAAGGYMQESTSTSMTIRVPAEKFGATVAAIDKLGEVMERNVKASDITELMIDLKIRLENAEAARQRLLALLEKIEKTEDLLKVQEQLARVTGEIEAMKGKIRYLESQAAMSTIRVDFNSPNPRLARPDAVSNLPFDWVQRLGDGLVAGALEAAPRKPGIFGRGPDFTLPSGFVRYYQSADCVEAMDAGDLRIKVQRHTNYDQADAEFWTQLAHKTLVEARSLAISGQTVSGDVGRIAGTRDVAGRPYEYLLTIRREKRHVITYEAWGPNDQFTAHRAALHAMTDRTTQP
jgi:hypothetical protein